MKKSTHLGTYGLILHNDQVLLIKKARGPYTGKYDLPGGKVEFGESFEAALQREINEETNLEAKSYTFHSTQSLIVDYINEKGEQIHFHHLGVIYAVEVNKDQNSLKTAGDDHDSLGAVWMELKDCKVEELSPFAREVLKANRTD